MRYIQNKIGINAVYDHAALAGSRFATACMELSMKHRMENLLQNEEPEIYSELADAIAEMEIYLDEICDSQRLKDMAAERKTEKYNEIIRKLRQFTDMGQ
jgi:pyruvate/oxaloacetate carboxyltransferase